MPAALVLTLLAILSLVLGSPRVEAAAGLQVHSGAKLIDDSYNDGDSFVVEASGQRLHLRLYFVDCPEAAANATADARRMREQSRYFGLADPKRILEFGKEAKRFVDMSLDKPFTVHTAYASAMGRTSRVYAFVTTSEGKDLASLLVGAGLARTRGVGRETPDGTSRQEMIEQLKDIEAAAMLRRAGIWSESRPDRIAELRAQERSEEQELKSISERGKGSKSASGPIDVNTATPKELQSIKGIGPVIAERIVAGRPYKSVDDLIRVPGIGPATLEKIRPYLVVRE
jgi:competence ComEA-like helix-hairpin-helix protein